VIRGSVLLLLRVVLVSSALAQSSTPPAGDTVRRFRYPSENFSIALPGTWAEIDAAILARLPVGMPRARTSPPETKFNHAFRPSEGDPSGYPWVAVMLSKDGLAAPKLEGMNSPYRSVDDLVRKWKATEPAGTVQNAQRSAMFYDTARQALWSVSQFTYPDIDVFRTISAAYLTTTGSVQVHCCSKASEYEKYRPVCKQILESVTIDPPPGVAAAPTGK
jgi:hypothetical protein